MSKTTTATSIPARVRERTHAGSTITARVLASDQPAYWSAGQIRIHFGGVSAMWIVRRLADSNFPKPVYLGSKRRYWRIEAVVAWEAARASAS